MNSVIAKDNSLIRTALSIGYLSILFCLLSHSATKADIIPDNMLPNNSTVRTVGNVRVIEGGTQRGANLFHSFQEFSFSVLTSNSTGDTAVFNHNLGVQNIINRITGGKASYIDGMITAIRGSRANLFFINPHGIIFGANASLNIGGSFVATTANSIKFADGTEFSATPTNNDALLTVSVPLGLQFGKNPGKIEQRISNDLPLELQVENGKTLALIGGNLLLESSTLTAPGGRIELGSVAGDGFVSLSEIDKGYALEYSGVKNFGDIKLAAGTLINTDNVPRQDSSGGIQIQGRNITIDDSLIFAVNFGVQSGDRLTISATESLKVSGSSIFTVAQNAGKAGDIWIQAKNYVGLDQEAFIASQVCSLGGDCQNVTGNGGNIYIETGRLLLTNGAGIEASTFGTGNAGNILIKATDSIELMGESNDGNISSGIFAQVVDPTKNAGNTGTITLETQRLHIQGGAQILNVARYGAQGGNVNINASESIYLGGASQFATASPLDIFRSGIFVSTQPETTNNRNTLNINTRLLTVEDGAIITADNLNIRGDRLIIQDGAKVTVTGAGNLVINGRSLKLDNQGQLSLKDVITLNTPEVDSSLRFALLPTNQLHTSKLTQTCSSDSSFIQELETKNSPHPIYLPNNLTSPLPTPYSQHSHLLQNRNFYPNTVVENPDSHKIVEAQGWVIDKHGNVTLVAQPHTTGYQHPWYLSTVCHVHE